MATPTLLDHLRTALAPHGAADRTDAELLGRFVTEHDEAAFKALLLRHGPMVWGVCRRVLGNEADAEDTFQATFLVLARKAACVRPRERVGNWLYGVAYHAALKARAMAAKRRAKERRAARVPTQGPAEPTGRELAGLLDRELHRLPAVYRNPIVLCDLQGKTRMEAARQLGWPEGTVAGRLARARALLARRLSRYGLAVSGAAVGTLLAEEASGAVPTSLVGPTVQAACRPQGLIPARVAALAGGTLKAMLLHKVLKVTAVLLVVTALAAGWYGYTAERDTPARNGRVAEAKPTRTRKPKSDLERLQGTWRVVSSQVGDEKASDEDVKRRRVTIKGNVLTYDFGNERGEKREGTVTLDPRTKSLDWASPQAGGTMLALYDLKGDDLKIGFGNDGMVRPRQWVIGKDDVAWLLVLKREGRKEQGSRPSPAAEDAKETPVQKEWKRLEGTWRPVAYESEGRKASGEEFAKLGFASDVLTIQKGKWRARSKGMPPLEAGLQIDPGASPKTMTLTQTLGEGKVLVSRSIYEVSGDTLRVCTNFEPGEVPPRGFTAKGSLVLVYRRERR